MNWLFGGANAPRAPVLVALMLLAASLILRSYDPPAVYQLRDFAFDSYLRIKPRVVEPDMPVHIVDIDEAALAEYGQWPWPRSLLAKLIDKLAEQGAAAIGLDMVFGEPDRSSIAAVVDGLPPGPETQDMKRLAATYPDNDALLADAIKRANVVTGFGFDLAGQAKPPRRFHGVAHNSGEADAKQVPGMIATFIGLQSGAVKNLDRIEAGAKGNGSITPEIEGAIVRRVPMLFRLAGQRNEDLFAALSIETVRVAQGASTYIVQWSGAQHAMSYGERTGVAGIRVGQSNIETDLRGRVTLWDSGSLPQRYVSAKDVLNGTAPKDKIEGNVLFVGTSAIGLKDLRNTPAQDSIPGVEIHAQIAEQILTQSYLSRRDYADGAEFLYLLLVGLIFVALLPRLPAWAMAIVAVFFVGAGVVVPWLAFSQIQLLFDPIYPSATLAMIYVVGSALAFMRTEKERAEIHGAFSMYMSPDVVEQVARNPALLKLGGEMREITVMFTDVRGFTTISEQFDPPGLTQFMNRFLTPMTDLIMSSRGTIDKYMGDAIMAFWNAPLTLEDPVRRGCATALAMQARLVELNRAWEAEAAADKRKHIPVNIGIGLNTGHASVGNFGSTQRLTYSCLGDSVNLASRLEGQCKAYAVGIIIGEGTRNQVPEMATLELDLIMVKGKTEPERMFTLMGDEAMAQSPAYRTLVERQAEFLKLYRSGAFAESLAAIAACALAAQELGWKQGYYAMMRERVDGLIDDSPVDWKGVYVAKEK